MTDPSEAIRDRIRKRLGQVEAEERGIDAAQKKLGEAGWAHHDVAGQLADKTAAGVDIADKDGADALLYEEARMDQRRGALVGGHMNRANKGEN